MGVLTRVCFKVITAQQQKKDLEKEVNLKKSKQRANRGGVRTGDMRA